MSNPPPMSRRFDDDNASSDSVYVVVRILGSLPVSGVCCIFGF